MSDGDVVQIARRIRIGGLMRCCLQTFDNYAGGTGPDVVGTVLPCQYCNSAMILAEDNTWEWYREYVAPS